MSIADTPNRIELIKLYEEAFGDMYSGEMWGVKTERK